MTEFEGEGVIVEYHDDVVESSTGINKVYIQKYDMLPTQMREWACLAVLAYPEVFK